MDTSRRRGSLQIRTYVIRAVLNVLLLGAHGRRRVRTRTVSSKNGLHILLTGTFYSENWIDAQLRPITLADSIKKVTFVSATPVPDIAGLSVVYPPTLLRQLIGRVPARLLTFAWHGIRDRPDIIGGFHLLINGLVAQLVARLSRTMSLYICVGGPTEVVGGGFATENRIFGRLAAPDDRIEKQLLKAVNAFDHVIVRGQSARSYFVNKGIEARMHIITAGVDATVFYPNDAAAEFDVVFLARLSQVKRVEIFLDVVALLKRDHSADVRALVIGDGPARQSAEQFVREKNLVENVQMVGQQKDVAVFLNKARIFVLTSKSEGVSQAMIQAMLCGLPAVVANVGSLEDLVRNGKNGQLVDNHDSAGAYVGPIASLLANSERWRGAGMAAREAALECSTERVRDKWDALLDS